LIGKLNSNINAETRFVWQWRATPFGDALAQVDYKSERALKSCHSEFSHIFSDATSL